MKKLSTRFGKVMHWFKRTKKEAGIETEPALDGGIDIDITPQVVDEIELPAKKEKLTRETALAKLQEGYDQVVDLLGNVRSHMEQQSERSERLLTMLEGMPEAIKTLPEVTRNQTRTLEAIQGNLETQTHHNGRLADALDGLSRTTDQHEQAMTAIGQQLDAGQQTSERMLDSFGALGGTLNQMSHSNEASADMLRRIAEQDSIAAEQVRELFLRNQKHMTTMSVVSWSLAIVALTVAGWVAVSITGLSPQNADITPVNNTPAPTAPAVSPDVPTTIVPASSATTANLLDDYVPVEGDATLNEFNTETNPETDNVNSENIQQASPESETKTSVTSIFESASGE